MLTTMHNHERQSVCSHLMVGTHDTGCTYATVKPRVFIRQTCTAKRGSASVMLKTSFSWAFVEPTQSRSATPIVPSQV
eukprot:SAG22_NODE_1825_length_3505_cov_3.818849_6_plen_78_part_00